MRNRSTCSICATDSSPARPCPSSLSCAAWPSLRRRSCPFHSISTETRVVSFEIRRCFPTLPSFSLLGLVARFDGGSKGVSAAPQSFPPRADEIPQKTHIQRPRQGIPRALLPSPSSSRQARSVDLHPIRRHSQSLPAENNNTELTHFSQHPRHSHESWRGFYCKGNGGEEINRLIRRFVKKLADGQKLDESAESDQSDQSDQSDVPERAFTTDDDEALLAALVKAKINNRDAKSVFERLAQLVSSLSRSPQPPTLSSVHLYRPVS